MPSKWEHQKLKLAADPTLRAAYNARKRRERAARGGLTPDQKAQALIRAKEWKLKHPERHREIQNARKRRRTPSWEGYLQNKIGAIRGRAKRKGLVFTITASDLMTLHRKQQGLCVLTGVEMLKTGWPYSCSIDRIDVSEGYIISNVRLVTWQANAARGIGSDEDLRHFCETVLRQLPKLEA